MLKIWKRITAVASAVAAVCFLTWMQKFGDWSILLIWTGFLGLICHIIVTDTPSRLKYWLVWVLGVASLVSTTGFRVEKTGTGRIQVVKAVYPLCPTVYIEGVCIDTIEVATGYSTFAGWFYRVERSTVYLIKDSNLSTVFLAKPFFKRLAEGNDLRIEEFGGPHGVINVFSFVDVRGNRVWRDFFGLDPYDEDYTVQCDVGALLDYTP